MVGRCREREIERERPAFRRHAQTRRPAPHRLSSKDAVRLLVNELDSIVAAYRFDAQGGSLQTIQILPSTPSNFTGELSSAEIAVAADGRFVYASNRCNNSIATSPSMNAPEH